MFVKSKTRELRFSNVKSYCGVGAKRGFQEFYLLFKYMYINL